MDPISLITVLKFLGRVKDFALKHKKAILYAVLIAIYTWVVYSVGFNRCDGIWIKENNRQVAALNKRIAELEQASHDAAVAVETDNQKLKKQLEEIVKKSPNMFAYNGDGTLFTCNNKPVPIYLGPEFARVWNVINEKGNAR